MLIENEEWRRGIKSVSVSGWERGEKATTNGERGVAWSSNIRAVRFTDYPSPALFVKSLFGHQ
jgi:hypothetical protein